MWTTCSLADLDRPASAAQMGEHSGGLRPPGLPSLRPMPPSNYGVLSAHPLAPPGAGGPARYHGHLLMHNRHGLAVQTRVAHATGTAEREAAVAMVRALPRSPHRTPVHALRRYGLTPHVAQNTTTRASAIDERTTRHLGYRVSQQRRKRVEELFGWLKTIALLRKTRHRGVRRVGWMFTFAVAVYNLVRIRNLVWAATTP
jgi:hypothetical protein